MADAKITQLNPLDASGTQAAIDVLAIADVSTTETKKITVAAVVEAGIVGVADGSIPGSKLTAGSVTAAQVAAGSITANALANNAVTTDKINNGAITAGKIAPDSITAREIAPNAIGSSELGDNSVDTAAIQDLAVTAAKIADRSVTGGKLVVGTVTTTEIADGTIATVDLADGSVTTPKIADDAVTTAKLDDNAVTTAKLGNLSVTGLKIANATITADKLADDLDGSEFLAQPPNFVLAGPASGANAAPGFRGLTLADLPTVGASKLPLATTTGLGIVQVGTGLAVSVGGVIRVSNTVTGKAGATKVTYDANGMITASTTLDAADIPDLDASKLTTGTLAESRIGDETITRDHLKNFSIAYIQEASPGTVDPGHIGMMWFQESTAGLHMWNGNSWMPISIGRLSQENLRYCGVIDASTGLVVGVTPFGTAAGYKIGDSLAAASDAHTGVYFVVSTPGNGIPESTGVTYDNGDWILCNGAAAGWVRIDTLNAGSSGGGGTAVTHLYDLLDVSTAGATTGQHLELQASGQWTAVAAPSSYAVLKAGDTMTGALQLPAAAPTADTEAANKKYVDDQVAGVAHFSEDATTNSLIPSTATNNLFIGGTTAAPAVRINVDGSAAFTAKATSDLTVTADPAATLTTKSYVDALSLTSLADVTLTAEAENSILALNGAGQWVNTLDVDGGENYGV